MFSLKSSLGSRVCLTRGPTSTLGYRSTSRWLLALAQSSTTVLVVLERDLAGSYKHTIGSMAARQDIFLSPLKLHDPTYGTCDPAFRVETVSWFMPLRTRRAHITPDHLADNILAHGSHHEASVSRSMDHTHIRSGIAQGRRTH